jgi:hypothetical protein
MWQNQMGFNRLRTPYIGLLNRPRPRTRSCTRKIELVGLTAKQIEDEDDKWVVKSILVAPTGCIKLKTEFLLRSDRALASRGSAYMKHSFSICVGAVCNRD